MGFYDSRRIQSETINKMWYLVNDLSECDELGHMEKSDFDILYNAIADFSYMADQRLVKMYNK